MNATFLTLPRNKTGLNFTDTLNEILFATLNDSNAETAMYWAMMMPHLILASTGTEVDASNNKAIARRSDQWIKWDIDSLFLESKIVQERMSRTKAKRSVDVCNVFNKYLSTERNSNGIRSLTEEATGGFLSLTDRVSQNRVFDVLREKHPEPCKLNLNYLVSNEHPKSFPSSI